MTERKQRDPATGGEKNGKPEEFALVPVFPRQEEARVYGHGAKKYEPNNWRRGYPWSWSVSALYRHLTAFEAGESIDKESGLHHLAHAKFHLNTLMEFERLGLGTNDLADANLSPMTQIIICGDCNQEFRAEKCCG